MIIPYINPADIIRELKKSIRNAIKEIRISKDRQTQIVNAVIQFLNENQDLVYDVYFIILLLKNTIESYIQTLQETESK